MFQEFKAFLLKTNALALAVGVIIGAAIGKVVAALTDHVLMPPISLLMPGGNWRDAKIPLKYGPDGKEVVSGIGVGPLAGAIVDFIIIAFVVFMITKQFLKPAPAAPTKTCPQCLEIIPAAAKKCRACQSMV